MSNARFAEVIGAPGAGKSTFVLSATSAVGSDHFQDLEQALFLELCRAHGVSPDDVLHPKRGKKPEETPQERRHEFIGAKFRRRELRFSSLTEFCAGHSELLASAFRNIGRNASEADRPAIIGWLFNFYAKYQYLESVAAEPQHILVDEGFVGRSITLFAYTWSKASHDDLRQYIRLIPRPHTVIRLHLDSPRCFNRLVKRPDGPPKRFNLLSVDEQRAILDASQECLEMAVAELIALGTHVVDVDATLEPEEQVSRVVQSLHNFGGPPPA